MARIAGVDLPKNKPVFIGLERIYGIGIPLAMKILAQTDIDPNKRVKDLTEEEVSKLKNIVENLRVEGALKAEIQRNIKRLMDIKCYRGIRHLKGLPVRGQRTRHNARTRKGPRGNIFKRKKKGG
ncbi:MAG: 30S ribosomal protein S13 [candidate division WOR-3 bacterium]|nr:30S ribosomal protein S13 [candidate division WOR-3 bacterium]MCX7947276.1 30S ribosomal protein S13 [candidate division WOR-3 bacterium]MDW8150167.1 30S ribosomal protein S13 [candidate division WOR-3 bacterium]